MGSTASHAEEPMAPPAGSVKKRKRDKHEQHSSSSKHSKRARSKSKPETVAENKVESALVLQNGALAKSQAEDVVDRFERHKTPVAQLATWKVSDPMGGRISDIDPIFSHDEKHLILIYNTSIQVYTAADSLLVRKIKPQLKGSQSKPARRLVAAAPSLVDQSVLWVADSAGAVWKVDWTTGATDRLSASCPTPILAMTTVVAAVGKKAADWEIVVTSEAVVGPSKVAEACQIAAYATTAEKKNSIAPGARRLLHYFPAEVRTLQATAQGTAFVGAGGKNILLASVQQEDNNNRNNKATESFDGLEFDFYDFDAPDDICSLDVRTSPRKASAKKKAAKHLSGQAAESVLDVVVGCARGAIYVYGDALAALQAASAGGGKSQISPRKHHWHPRTVHSVKWSLDGEYFVSGGTENTLVLWQVDTGRREYLPHLQASIESIVVSPSGASYALTLDDNSAMVLSTAEMRPTTYVSGMQSLVLRQSPRKDSSVERVWSEPEEISYPLTAAVNPADPSQLFLCVGNGQMATSTDLGAPPSASLLQVFDISSFQSVAKQALARSNPTEHNITPKGFPVTEPWIPHIAFSNNGDWLASVDEWQPPARDMESLADGGPHGAEALCQSRKEVYLKFWKVGKPEGGATFLELVSRLDEAHFSNRPESILGLAASPRSTLFGTVGADSNVRLWAPHTQRSSRTPSAAAAVAASAGKGALTTTTESAADVVVEGWSCVKVIPLAANTRFENEASTDEVLTTSAAFSSGTATLSGALTFSDDGSTLFVASGLPDEVVLYIIDAASGEVRNQLDDVVRGEVRDMQVLGSRLVVLAGNLVVYDVVEDRVRFGVSFDDNSPPEATRMTHLAVDRAARAFAIAVPVFQKPSAPFFGRGTASELAVFSLLEDDGECGEGEPVLVQTLPHLVTALLAVPGTSSGSGSGGGGGGFLTIDAAAQVSAVMRATASNPLALPLSDLRLEDVDSSGDDVAADGMELGLAMDVDGSEDGGGADDDDDCRKDGDEDDDDEDMETYGAIIVPERLAEIFDGAPAFALPPIEDLFYRVSSLVSPRPPLAASSAA